MKIEKRGTVGEALQEHERRGYTVMRLITIYIVSGLKNVLVLENDL
ncbi:hypothetical protein F441_12481 [Phytophthora nicotianae CJ01A1]|uniref:Uncharacterized protein n=4 Tax=Phytophthora nicotianae TaxID=4792 RepID=W2PYT8_PHYN3|nr:hypothetical protein PPTG_23438 [Phytophthora nicotianae INRA-310]ETK82372.1 hypothetical protein L915_12232 [Phytophthora nicotianae]ETO70972.1 hypothetical protein F444_12614 [Phytophthora nicotianae P1976]ETP12086.1 hypothetical protein F441_12481 [Phytophthora nicotianae CJ01A1]ETL35761.1 hypothetical protein L916_12154 [Phytophthora nicotianae]ETL88999.1 hypothetical protein L917_11991 [Phytophthora nicotianae]